MKTKTIYSYVLIALFITSLAGCDKILNKSEQKKKPAAAPQPAQVSQSIQMNDKGSAKGSEAKGSPAAKPVMTKDVLARVGNWTLTRAEFDDRLKALKAAVPEFDMNDLDQNKAILNELIRQQLLVQDAQNKGVAENKDIVQAVEEFRRTLLVREVATTLTKDITVTEEDAREYYEQNKADFAEPPQWRVREIVVEDEEEAKGILVELSEGADFLEMVKKSKSKSAWQKGDLGLKSEFDFPKMTSIVSTLDVGDMSRVFEGPEGFYIVKLEEKQGGEPADFEEIKEDIISGLSILRQQEAILNHLTELEGNTEIEINENILQESSDESGK